MTTPSNQPITFPDLILPSSETSLSSLLTSLKKSSITLTNRLHSISSDAAFVTHVAEAYGRPLVANERCGSWYVDVERKRDSAYFKSTDGHTGAWKMSTRRLNVHLLGLMEENDGIIIVDSTRRGKKMPDALSKTIPIWCTVLNILLFPDIPSSHTLHTPPTVVSPSEHSSITTLLPSFVTSLSTISSSLNIPLLRQTIAKPLRPLWVTPDTPLPQSVPDHGGIFTDFRPVICCTASARSTSGELAGESYVQGAADDTEMWAHGLTAVLFWKYKEVLLGASEGELTELMERLAREEEKGIALVVGVTRRISVGTLPGTEGEVPGGRARILLRPDSLGVVETERELSVGLGKHKAASRNLRVHLGMICTFAESVMGRNPDGSIVILCESGKDVSVGVALAVDCWVFNEDGGVKMDGKQQHTKTSIRVRLGKIMVKCPGVNPSRNTLQSVNSFLMG